MWNGCKVYISFVRRFNKNSGVWTFSHSVPRKHRARSEVRVNCLLSEALFLCCTQSDVLIQGRVKRRKRRSKRFLWSCFTWASLTHTSNYSVCKRFLSDAVWAMQVNPGSGSGSGTKLLLNAELLIFITVYDMKHEARCQRNILQPHLSSAQVFAAHLLFPSTIKG